MKQTEPKNVFIASLLIFSCIITIYSFTITTTGTGRAASSIRIPVQKLESFSGQSEFYYKPAGDTRIWHVINKYSDFNSGNSDCYNMSDYTFNSDSVFVVNRYAGVQNQNQLDVTSNDFTLIANNFNNK